MTKKNIYCEVAQWITREITSGEWTFRLPGKNILANKYHVNPRTVMKALKILEQQGKIEIEPARGCFIRKRNEYNRPEKKVVAVVSRKFYYTAENIHQEKLFYTRIADEYGYQVVFIGFEEDLFQSNRQLILNFPVQGFYFQAGTLRSEQRQVLNSHQIPFVCSTRQYGEPPVDFADCDHRAGIHLLLDHLKRQGHHYIAFLEFTRSRDYLQYLDMIRNYFIQELRQDFRQGLFFPLDVSNNESGNRKLMRDQIIKALRYLFLQPAPPSAIVASQLILRYIREELKGKLQIPEELSLAFVDYDLLDEGIFWSGLSYPLKKIEETAFRRLLSKLSGSDPEDTQEILIPPQFILRDSISKGPYFKE